MTEKTKRILASVFGVALCGICVAMMQKANFGTDPFTCFTTGIANIFGTTYGTIYPVLNAVLLVVILLLDRHYIGLATVINLFGVGTIADLSLKVINNLCPEVTSVSRWVFLLVGLILMCLSSSLYFTADLGVSTYDAMALIASDKKIAPFRFCRIATDLVCVVVGYIFGATIGIGTLITAFFMGPVIDLFNIYLSRPLILGIRPEKKKA